MPTTMNNSHTTTSLCRGKNLDLLIFVEYSQHRFITCSSLLYNRHHTIYWLCN
eukprot:UN18846